MSLLVPPKAAMGHPDPNHPSNRFKDDAAKLVDWEGRPVVRGLPWGEAGSGLWLFVAVSEAAPPTPTAADGAKAPRVARWSVGGVWFTVGCTEGRPSWPSGRVFGNAMELPHDLARDELKKTLVMDWLRDMAQECCLEAALNMGFKGLPGTSAEASDKMSRFLAGGAEHVIKGMGL